MRDMRRRLETLEATAAVQSQEPDVFLIEWVGSKDSSSRWAKVGDEVLVREAAEPDDAFEARVKTAARAIHTGGGVRLIFLNHSAPPTPSTDQSP